MGKKKSVDSVSSTPKDNVQGFETAVIRFRRKPAKMGADYIFWIPRTYIRNGLVDPTVEYEVYLKRVSPTPAPQTSAPAPPREEASGTSPPDSS